VNGKTFAMPWAPFEADVTEALRPGVNEVAVEVIAGAKTSWGPCTCRGRPGRVRTVRPDHPKWTPDYLLVDHGLTVGVVVETVE